MSDSEKGATAMDVDRDEDELAAIKDEMKDKVKDEGDDSDDEKKHKKKKKKKDREKDKDKTDRKKSRKDKGGDKEDGVKKEEDAEDEEDGKGDHKKENGRDSTSSKPRDDDDDDDLLKDEREKRNLKEPRDRERDRDRGGRDGRDRGSRGSRDRSRSRGRDNGRDRDRGGGRRRSPSRDRGRRRSPSRDRRSGPRSYSRDRGGRRGGDRERYRRPKSRSRSRTSRDRRRRRSPSSSSSRSRSPRRSPSKKEDKTGAQAVAIPVNNVAFADPNRIPTLQEMLTSNPGMGIPEALQKIEEIKKTRMMQQHMAINMPSAQQPATGMGMGMGGMGAGLIPNVVAGLAAAQQMASVLPNAAATKSQRELYVGNLPTGITGPQLAEFLGGALVQLKLIVQPGNPIINTWMSSDAHYAFCEFRTIDECNAALNLNGISVGPTQLRIGRPKNYSGPQPTSAVGMNFGALGMNFGGIGGMGGLGGVGAAPLGMAGIGAGMTGLNLAGVGMPGAGVGAAALGSLGVPGMTPAAAVAAPANVFLMMCNIPQAVDETSVKALLQPFGELKSFNLLKDSEGKSKGTAVFEYTERARAEAALKLSNIDILGQKLQVQEISGAAAQALLQPVASAPATDEGASVILRLGNMVDESMLNEPDEVAELREEVADECRKFGTVVSVEVPVPEAGGERGAGQGYIFVEFADTGAACRARKALKGRSFDGKTVEAEYYSKDLYELKSYGGQTMDSAAPASNGGAAEGAAGIPVEAAAAAPVVEAELD